MKTIRIIAAVLIVLILIPIVSWIFWNFRPSKKLNILIVNKTVLEPGIPEQKALFWVLNNEKFVNDRKKMYKMHRDYYGFHPQKPLKERKYEINRIRLTETEQLSDEYDAAYFVDTYGVFFNEWYDRNVKGKGTLIEGGLNNSDFVFLDKMHEKNKLIVAEYNFLSAPTDGLIRNKAENLLGFHWSGWSGRYVQNLNADRSRDLPAWVVDMYQLNHKGEWPFSGSGILLVNEGRKAVIVLESDVHLDENKVPEIQTTEEGMEQYGLPESVLFPSWFNIVENDSNLVLGEYKIHINMEGKTLLDKYGLPSRFPAILASGDGSPFYYFAGDFIDFPVSLSTARLSGIRKIGNTFHSRKQNSMADCYWTYYVPLISRILEDYQASLN